MKWSIERETCSLHLHPQHSAGWIVLKELDKSKFNLQTVVLGQCRRNKLPACSRCITASSAPNEAGMQTAEVHVTYSLTIWGVWGSVSPLHSWYQRSVLQACSHSVPLGLRQWDSLKVQAQAVEVVLEYSTQPSALWGRCHQVQLVCTFWASQLSSHLTGCAGWSD